MAKRKTGAKRKGGKVDVKGDTYRKGEKWAYIGQNYGQGRKYGYHVNRGRGTSNLPSKTGFKTKTEARKYAKKIVE